MSKTFDSKSIREKLEELYKNVDLTQDDRKILIKEKRGIINQERAQDPAWREKVAQNNRDPLIRAKRKASMPDQTGENNPFFGKKHKDKTREAISSKKKGSAPTFKGKKHTDDALQKMRTQRSEHGKANMRKPRSVMLTCPICGRTGAAGNMIRYHMENPTFQRTPKCKPKKNNQ